MLSKKNSLYRLNHLNILRLNRILKTDSLGNIILFKRILLTVLGFITYNRFNTINKLKIEGIDHLLKLPDNNVMFISNHQTYYADVMAMYHTFNMIKWRLTRYRTPLYMLIPKVNIYYIAARETMHQNGLVPKILAMTGAITVKRSWRHRSQSVNRNSDIKAPDKIKKALHEGWVINFPQGTTCPYAPVRKGTANIIKSFKPIVVPVVIDGFRRAFDRQGLLFKVRGTTLSLSFKSPIVFSSKEDINSIVKQITKSIDQERVIDWKLSY